MELIFTKKIRKIISFFGTKIQIDFLMNLKENEQSILTNRGQPLFADHLQCRRIGESEPFYFIYGFDGIGFSH